MNKTFEDALNELLDHFCTTPVEVRISALELALMALRDEERDQEEPTP